MQLKDTTRTSRLNDIVTAATTVSHLIVYTGTAPSKTVAPTGTPLVNFTMANPLGTVSVAILTITNPAGVNGSASGVPGYFRIIDGATDDGTHTQIQGTAAVGSGELNFNANISLGGPVSLSGLTITEGNP